MFISDELRKNVAFVGFDRDGEPDWRGTAFIVATPSARPDQAYHYVVTAKHVVVQISEHSVDKQILLRINHTDGDGYVYKTRVSDWAFHPDSPSIDIAAAPIWLGPLIDLKSMPLAALRDQRVPEWVRVGTDVFFPGLFYPRSGDRLNLPIVRFGAISALPDEPIYLKTLGARIDAYLIESRSIGGLSGSPVFAYRETFTGPYSVDWEVLWIGLMHGHFDTYGLPPDPNDLTRRLERVNMGLAMVVPARNVLDVVDQPRFRDHRLSEGASA
jgi:hypothetical protein